MAELKHKYDLGDILYRVADDNTIEKGVVERIEFFAVVHCVYRVKVAGGSLGVAESKMASERFFGSFGEAKKSLFEKIEMELAGVE